MTNTASTDDGQQAWLLVETMGAGQSLVFDADRSKNFTSINRRQHHRGDRISAALNDLVAEVRTSGQLATRTVRLRDTSTVHVLGAPVFGPNGVVFAVQVLLTPEEGAAGFFAAKRSVGAFEWDPANQITYHGPTMETEIMGVVDDPQAERVSPEIFKLFDEFPRMAELGAFVTEMMSGTITEDDTFDSDLLMTGVDGRQRSAYMTFRAVQRPDKTWFMRGLVHDISDVKPPAPAAGFNAGLVRSAFGMTEPPNDAGIGHLNFPTKVITEWFHEPPAPLDRWTTENAIIHPDDQELFDKQIATLSSGEVDTATFDIRVKFLGTGWISTNFNLRAALPGDMGQGLVKVTPVSPGPGELPPLDPDSGIMAW